MSADSKIPQKPMNKHALTVWHAVPSLLKTQEACHQLAVDSGWWSDPQTGQPINRNKGELLALIHSEISEALEGFRKDMVDEHLPHLASAEVELADAVIRIFDLAEYCGFELGDTIAQKLEYNAKRVDHKIENRGKLGGKKF